jgi:hypothetical protein
MALLGSLVKSKPFIWDFLNSFVHIHRWDNVTPFYTKSFASRKNLIYIWYNIKVGTLINCACIYSGHPTVLPKIILTLFDRTKGIGIRK